jgi:hypothetical protein
LYALIIIMKISDYYFHYKYISRFLLLEKIGSYYYNTYTFTKIEKLNIFFVIKNLVDFENLKSSNYFFFFKYFFGKKAKFINYKTRFSLNVWYHNFKIQLVFAKKDLYIFINFLFNDILPFCNKRYMILNFKNTINFKILDMNIFLEKKTHVGFFNLKETLNMSFLSYGSKIEKRNLYNILKFKI